MTGLRARLFLITCTPFLVWHEASSNQRLGGLWWPVCLFPALPIWSSSPEVGAWAWGATMLLIAHRARCIPDQENSFSGLAGLPADVDGIEVDVRVTLDGVPVLIHDSGLDRLTGIEGRVDEWNFPALQRLRLQGADEPPPRMVDYLLRAAGVFWGGAAARGGRGFRDIYLDIKCNHPAAVSSVVRHLRELPFSSGLVCLAREPGQFEVIASEGGGSLRLGLLGCCRESLDGNLEIATRYGLEVLFLRHGFDAFRENVDVIPEIRMRGFKVGGSIINGPSALDFARSSGCDMVLTDFSRAPH